MTIRTTLVQASVNELREIGDAIRLYSELMYTCDLVLFDEMFHPDARLFTVEGGQPMFRFARDYRDILAKRQSPQALGKPREEQLIAIDIASPTQALVEARVRINHAAFIDHFVLLRFTEGWRIVSNAYHHIDL